MSQRPSATFSNTTDHSADLVPGTRVPFASAIHQEVAIKILVFDSDPIACASLGSWLNRRGHSVALACTHDMATTLLQRIRFDLAICEDSAPCYDAQRWLDKLVQRPPCHLVLISATPTLDAAIRAANQPVAGYLPKPVDRIALAVVLERIFGKPGR